MIHKTSHKVLNPVLSGLVLAMCSVCMQIFCLMVRVYLKIIMNLCRQAGRWQESERILQQLIDNAVTQHQYSLAASLHHQLAMEAVDEVQTSLTMLVLRTNAICPALHH